MLKKWESLRWERFEWFFFWFEVVLWVPFSVWCCWLVDSTGIWPVEKHASIFFKGFFFSATHPVRCRRHYVRSFSVCLHAYGIGIPHWFCRLLYVSNWGLYLLKLSLLYDWLVVDFKLCPVECETLAQSVGVQQPVFSHLCRVTGNTIWSHMACEFL